jgi:predicted enzyme related to lactoylglutathione lyase
MASSEPEISGIFIDCTDPELLATFWSQLLDRKIGGRKGPYIWLEPTPSDACGLGFQRAAEKKLAKNRVHPDLRCDDVLATAARVEELGGTRVAGFELGGFLVVADPEGNEFCLLPRGPLGMDDDGNVHYLDA